MKTMFVLVLLVSVAAPVRAQEAAADCAGSPTVVFDHTAKPEIMSASLKLADKERFLIRVVNTAPAAFSYRVSGAVAVPQPRLAGPETASELTVHVECVTHSRQFGGYLMRVERNDGAKTELPNKLFIVSVETDDWQYEISGGFSVARFAEDIYALTPTGDGQFRVVQDEGSNKESDVRLGVASLITVFHSRRPQLGYSFGIGVNEGSRVTYYLGPTWRLGNVAGITGGVAWGPVPRLPDGVNLNDVVSDVNLLKTLPNRTDTAVFVSISYSFLGSLDTLKKPFAGQ